MPAKAPAAANAVAVRLALLGPRIRAQRKGLGVSAAALAKSAGMSRLTVYRIERRVPSVTVGACLNALAARGLDLAVVDHLPPTDLPADLPTDLPADLLSSSLKGNPAQADPAVLPARIRLADHAQLRQLAWQVPGVVDLSPVEALALYQRNWRHVDTLRMLPSERRLVDQLVRVLGQGRILVHRDRPFRHRDRRIRERDRAFR